MTASFGERPSWPAGAFGESPPKARRALPRRRAPNPPSPQPSPHGEREAKAAPPARTESPSPKHGRGPGRGLMPVERPGRAERRGGRDCGFPLRPEEARAMTAKRARALRRDMTDAWRKPWNALRGRRLAGAKFRRRVPVGPLRRRLPVEALPARGRGRWRPAWRTRGSATRRGLRRAGLPHLSASGTSRFSPTRTAFWKPSPAPWPKRRRREGARAAPAGRKNPPLPRMGEGRGEG